MGSLILDTVLIALLVIGLTAFLAVIVNGIGTKVIGKKNSKEYLGKGRSYQNNWKAVGGTKK
ncbi:hypothetical protein RZN22_02995 [Bacillaceae bacterium S4-13-58]